VSSSSGFGFGWLGPDPEGSSSFLDPRLDLAGPEENTIKGESMNTATREELANL
jgi:hypothetical protein